MLYSYLKNPWNQCSMNAWAYKTQTMTTTNVAISNIVTATKTPSTIFTDSIPVCIIHGSPRRPQSCVSHELEVLLSENKSYKYFDLIPTLVTYAQQLFANLCLPFIYLITSMKSKSSHSCPTKMEPFNPHR